MATRITTPSTERARYYASADGFNIKRPPVPAHVFLAERDRALDAGSPTGLWPCDLGATLDLPYPATTPLILARYARIRAGETLTTRLAASGEIHHAIAGGGETSCGGDRVAWEAGDTVVLPGGLAVTHRAGARDAVLWIVTDEPALAFARARPPAPGEAAVEIAHYPGDEVRRQLEAIHRLPPEKTTTGKAVTLSQRRLDGDRTCLPALTLAMNSLAPGESQRAHRHNAVAVTLIVQGQGCHSVIAGQPVAWPPWATMITPPGDSHSHHNEGGELALFFIVQDGGLHYHLRTMDFRYTPEYPSQR